MTANEIGSLIERLTDRYGFPVFVVFWLLWERKVIMTKLISVMEDLRSAITDVKK